MPFTNVYKAPEELDLRNPHHRPIVLGLAEQQTTRECLEQFLAWLVRRAVAWHVRGLGEKPGPLKAAQRAYVEDNDEIGSFINNYCERGEGKEFVISTTHLREVSTGYRGHDRS